jgi:outer membrane protein OmpA-like peptidoglycan-associated protein
MHGHRPLAALRLGALIFALIATPPAGHAGFGDALKKKAAEKATKKAEDAVDKAVDKPATPAKEAGTTTTGEGGAAGATEGSASGASAAGGAGASEKVSAVSTKFDFVSGDSLIFLDDFTQDELGEFPARWRLTEGTFEVAEMDGERWLRGVGVDGWVRMKLPAWSALPEYWTLEFDFYSVEPNSSALAVRALSKQSEWIWWVTFPMGNLLEFRTGAIRSATVYEGNVSGRHHVMFMGRGTAVKVYVDRQRMASIPEISADNGAPVAFDIRFLGSAKPMIANVRFASGCRPAKDMLAAGKLVTYGILFATGSDDVLPESAPVLRQIGAYLAANPAVKLRITGHTDNVGSAASNLDLSKRRAASVARVLTEQFGIAADRLTADGRGDTQVVANNLKPEGRAMNRRVEFARL